VQASRAWVPPAGTLAELIAEARTRVASIDRQRGGAAYASAARTSGLDALGGIAASAPTSAGHGRPVLSAALRRDRVAVIAEIKRRSPSRGVLNESLDAEVQAAIFEKGGAAAISVLTEPSRFGGSLEDLSSAAAGSGLPLLRKDFHVDPVQLVEAVHHQASAVLLIARALPPDELSSMIQAATQLGLESVVEVRTDAELAIALEVGAAIVGVNSRDLETLEVDERVPARLIPRIPPEVVAVWESGVSHPDHVRAAAECGADAVLVGSSLSQSGEPGELLRSITSIPRGSRRG
jgi:indole-3-glycerol phosphate synthase